MQSGTESVQAHEKMGIPFKDTLIIQCHQRVLLYGGHTGDGHTVTAGGVVVAHLSWRSSFGLIGRVSPKPLDAVRSGLTSPCAWW